MTFLENIFNFDQISQQRQNQQNQIQQNHQSQHRRNHHHYHHCHNHQHYHSHLHRHHQHGCSYINRWQRLRRGIEDNFGHRQQFGNGSQQREDSQLGNVSQNDVPERDNPCEDYPQRDNFQNGCATLRQYFLPRDRLQCELSQRGSLQLELPQRDLLQHELSQQDLQRELSKQDILQRKHSQGDSLQRELSRQDLLQRKLFQEDSLQRELSQQDLLQSEFPLHDLQRDLPHQATSQNENHEDEIPQRDIPQNDESNFQTADICEGENTSLTKHGFQHETTNDQRERQNENLEENIEDFPYKDISETYVNAFEPENISEIGEASQGEIKYVCKRKELPKSEDNNYSQRLSKHTNVLQTCGDSSLRNISQIKHAFISEAISKPRDFPASLQRDFPQAANSHQLEHENITLLEHLEHMHHYHHQMNHYKCCYYHHHHRRFNCRHVYTCQHGHYHNIGHQHEHNYQ